MSDEYFRAIKNGDIQKVRELIEQNPSLVDTKDESGMSGVVVATYYSQSKVSDLLISKGAALDFFEAAMTGRLEVLRKFSEVDPKLLKVFSKDGFTALHLAAFFGHEDVAKFLVEQGSDVNAISTNAMRVTPLHSAVAHNHLEISKLLVSGGADVNAKQEGLFTPLHGAAQNGNLEISEMLVSKGADINARTNDGKTPLDLTQEEGPEAGKREDRERVAKFLLSKGATHSKPVSLYP
jgi:uncharacterized protein